MEEQTEILQPKTDVKETEYNRAQRRKMERHAVMNTNRLRRRNKLITDAKLQMIHEAINSYKKSYNDYIQVSSEAQSRGIRSVDLVMGLESIHAPFDEIASQVTNGTQQLEKARIEGTKQVRLRYLRIDFIIMHNAAVIARPGVPEKVTALIDGYKKEQLFYHALVPLETESKEHEMDADSILVADLHTHLICMGIDMQQMNNNKLWNNQLHVQTENLQAKADEVTEIFSKIGDNAKEE